MPPRKKAQPKLTPEQAKASILGEPGVQPRPVEHLSYSGRSTYEDCPKRYELSYLMNAPRKGAVWFVGGSAVHRMTEEWDRFCLANPSLSPDLTKMWRRAFNETLEQAKAKDPEHWEWRKAGVKKENPQGEDLAHWYSVLGPDLVKAYMQWRGRASWEIWTTPDGEPAIELDVGGMLPMSNGLAFKGFIDRVFVTEQNTLFVVDLKTGTRKPEDGLQFGTYAAALEHKYGVKVPHGAAFMNRRGILAESWDLTKFTPEYVGKQYRQTDEAIRSGYFVPKVGRHCGLCDVADSCYANNGPLAHIYDRDHPERSTPF